MKPEEVYLKLPQSAQVVNRKIFLKDVAEIYTSDTGTQKKIGDIILYTVSGDKNQKLIFSVMKLIETIQKEHPGLKIINIGEPDFIVEYKMPIAPKKGMEYFKLVILSLVVFLGAAFTIMTFNTDVSVGEVFDNLYYLVTGTKKNSGSVLEIAYSAGILLGILGFYNHFKGQKLHDDPTPIHIEMRNYEEEMNKAIIKDADREGKTIK
ncbi:stage V sporulation protein AA [bacterium 1xD8-6]|jgi:Stage V sporulation protein AA.|nr:stage V sporulation protein AA [bacterium D16-36]RKI73482.1 stage V sporulation protein AA [bacterium 1xD8-6]